MRFLFFLTPDDDIVILIMYIQVRRLKYYCTFTLESLNKSDYNACVVGPSWLRYVQYYIITLEVIKVS